MIYCIRGRPRHDAAGAFLSGPARAEPAAARTRHRQNPRQPFSHNFLCPSIQ
nr:MAG TPA: hypothetical protein [Caudoviricetes sp.]